MKINIQLKAEEINALTEVLLNYASVPGSYALNMGQPALVFQNFDTIIAWALGKTVGVGSMNNNSLQEAAIFFIQRACFGQENTYYDVMRLGRQFSTEELRLRYRALISLTHPDKGIPGISADSAVRINKAYEILRDSVKRSEYDVTLKLTPHAAVKPAELDSVRLADDELLILKNISGSRLNYSKFAKYAIPIVVASIIIAVISSQSSADLQLVEKSFSVENSLVLKPVSSAKVEPMIAEDIFATNISEYARKDSSLNNKAKITAEDSFTGNRIPVQETRPQNVKVESQGLPVGGSSIATVHRQDAIKVSSPESDKTTPLNPQVSTSNIQQASASGSEPKRASFQSNEAKSLVSQLITRLENPKDAEIWQNRLIKQGVSGNLFGLALPLIRQSTTIRIDQLVVREQLESNRIILNGNIALSISTATSQLAPYRYAVHAEFNTNEQGLALSSFDLKESK